MNKEEKLDALMQAQARNTASTAAKRLAMLFDDGAYTEIDAFAGSAKSRAEAAAAHGTVEGIGVYAIAQDPDTSGGAMSKAQAAKFSKIYDLALKTGEPIVTIFDSVGGRLDEGAELLAAYGDILCRSNQLSGVLPQISVILGKCLGTQALIAAGSDVIVMSEKAQLSIDVSGKDSSAADAAGKGIAHIIAKDDEDAVAKARALISILPQNNLSTACVAYDSISAEGIAEDGMTAAEAAKSVADAGSLNELQSACGKAALTALATINGSTVGLIAFDGKELDGKSCRKAARLVRFCDSFSIPVVTFVNAEKFVCLDSTALLADAYSDATCAKVAVITGDAFGSVYIATAGTGSASDMTYGWVNASVSALTPDAAAVVMLGDDFGGKLKGSTDPKKDREAIIAQFKSDELTAMKAAEAGHIDEIIEASQTRDKIIAALDMLYNKRVPTLPKKHST